MTYTNDRLLTSREFAAFIGVHPATPKKWRHQGRGPEFVKLTTGAMTTGAIRYEMGAVESWLAARRIKPKRNFAPLPKRSPQSGWKAWIASLILTDKAA